MGSMMRAFRARGGAWVTLTLMLAPLASAAGEITLSDPNGQPGPGPAFGLTAFLEIDRQAYHHGDMLDATYRVVNETETPYVLQLNQLPAFNLWILFDGIRIWSDTWGTLPVQTSLTVGPGESLVTEYTWDLTNNEGQLVSPGEYDVMAVTHGDAPSLSMTVTILPEPATFALLALGWWIAPRRRGPISCLTEAGGGIYWTGVDSTGRGGPMSSGARLPGCRVTDSAYNGCGSRLAANVGDPEAKGRRHRWGRG
jgi:hypothetical protein